MYTDYISGFGECFICSKEEIIALKDFILFDGNAEYGGQLVQCYVHKHLDLNYAYITDIKFPTTD